MKLSQIRNHITLFKLCFTKTSKTLAGLAFFSLSTVLFALAYNLYAGNIIDKSLQIAGNKGSFEQIVVPLVIFMSILLFMSISESVKNYFEVIYNNSIALIMDDYKYTKNLSLDLQTYIDPKFTEKKEMLEGNGWKVTGSPKTVIEFFSAVIPVILYVSILFAYDWKIGALVVLSSIPIVYSSTQFGKRIWNIWEDNSNIKVTWNMYRNALWGNITDIKLLGAGKYIVGQMLFHYQTFLSKINANEKQLLRNLLVSTVIEYFLLIAAYVILFQGIIAAQFTVGAFFVITAILWGVKRELGNAFEKYSVIESDANFIDDFIAYMNMQPVIMTKPNAVKVSKDSPLSIEFRDVWFKYPNATEWIFKGVSFTISQDEDVAIVGKNGAGKTTLVKLITRMYDVTKGNILINGAPITDIDLDEYYKMIGLLSQDFRVFEFSARENIEIGAIEKKGSLADVKHFSELAHADSFINKLKVGYDTCLTTKVENGQELSGGQLQRIAIARIFYREPKLLIMDEPTSAIDSLAEEEIFNNIFDFSENRTVIIISHRFATIKRASRIIVVDNGVIAQDGTHQELLATDGLYKQMYTAQE